MSYSTSGYRAKPLRDRRAIGVADDHTAIKAVVIMSDASVPYPAEVSHALQSHLATDAPMDDTDLLLRATRMSSI